MKDHLHCWHNDMNENPNGENMVDNLQWVYICCHCGNRKVMPRYLKPSRSHGEYRPAKKEDEQL